MKVFFSAGEASGDWHAAAVARALKERVPALEMQGMGGAEMRAAGVTVVHDIADLGVIGIAEIIRKLPFFFRLRSELLEAIRRQQPDVVVCVDYPGFNMKLAQAVKKELGIPVVYYIAPTIWAWHRSRGKAIARDTAAVASIFPMDVPLYRADGARVEFVGHPLVDLVRPEWSQDETRAHFPMDPAKKQLLLLPGSRRQEVRSLLPTMLAAAELLAKEFPLQCWLPRASTISEAELAPLLAETELDIQMTTSHLHDLMTVCDAALAASGTVTLETALLGLPTVLCYKVAPLTYWLGRRVLQTPHIGLPNIVAGREVIPEFLQQDVTAENLAHAVASWWRDEEASRRLRDDLAMVREKLGAPGAVGRVADLIIRIAEENND